MASVSNQYFTIQANDQYEPYLENILDMVSEKASIVRSFFGVHEYRPVKVSLFEDLEDLKDEANKTKKKFEEYAEGSFSNKGIGVFVKQKLTDKNLMGIVNKVIHQYSHIIYASIYNDKFDRPLWLDEGIAQTLSGERIALQNSKDKSKSAFLSRIVGRRKGIPTITDLKNEGTGQHTIGSPRYSGYLLSYFMVNYLLSSKIIKTEETSDDYILLDNAFNVYEQPGAFEKLRAKRLPFKNRYNMNLVINDPVYRKKIEDVIIVRTLNYFGSHLGVKMSAASYKAIKTPQDILDYMDANFSYGWFDEKNEIHKDNALLNKRYHVASFDDILSKSYGTPIEYAKFVHNTLERLKIQASVFVNCSVTKSGGVKLKPFVVYLQNDVYGLIEMPFSSNAGIYKFDSFRKLINAYKANMKPGDTLYEPCAIPDNLSYQNLIDYINTSELVHEVPLSASNKELK